MSSRLLALAIAGRAVTVLAALSPDLFAQVTHLHDDFDGSVLSADWETFVNEGSVTVGGSTLSLRAPDVSRFPYIRTTPGLLQLSHPDWVLELDLAWSSTGPCGNGFMAGGPALDDGGHDCLGSDWSSSFPHAARVWRATLLGGTRVTAGATTMIIPLSGPGVHGFRWESANGVVSFFLDDVLTFSGPSNGVLPENLWFGNPCRTTTCVGSWSAIDVERVALKSTLPVSNYCVAAPNSAGPGATLTAMGSASLADGDFTLQAADCPPGALGLFRYGHSQAQVAFGDGFRCIAGAATPIYPIDRSDAGGLLTRTLDFTRPYATGIMAGPVHFQCTYRDAPGGPAGFNASDGLTMVFAP